MILDKDRIKTISIESYLKDRGFVFKKQHGLSVCTSPFSRDSNWSFKVYPTNTYFDYANGFGGDIIDLVSRMDNCSFVEALESLSKGDTDIYKPNYKELLKVKNKAGFDYRRFISHDANEILSIQGYANSRGIHSGYEYGKFFQMHDEEDEWVGIPALLFLHRDRDLKVTGGRFRAVPTPTLKHKFGTTKIFSSRGTMGWYVLENISDGFDVPEIYIIESETSANSLWEYYKSVNKSAIILSTGNVGVTPPIPDKYNEITNVNIIIDYDGDEKTYRQRLEEYKKFYADKLHLSVNYITLRLEKGDDINSLWSKDEMYVVSDLLL